MSSLKVAVIQFTPAFGKKEANLARIEALTENLEADVVVLPELCTTGYFFLSREEVAQVAEPLAGPTGAFFKKMSERLGALVFAGFAECDGEKLFNACMIAMPGRDLRCYRKTHLFYKEKYCFDPGDSGFFVVADTQIDLNVGTMVCYDWRFPEASRVLALLGADLIVCPSNLVTDAWQLVMPARAIENRVYLAVANRAGAEQRAGEELVFKGNSAIYGYNGQVLQSAGARADAVVCAEIDPEKTRSKAFNSVNDVFGDRQPHHYRQLTAG